MEIAVERLLKRCQVLGNHHRKFILLIRKNYDGLIRRIEQARMNERIHLLVATHDYTEEMTIIAALGKTSQEKLDDLACYFAFQFLHMNLSALDALMLEAITVERKYQIYQNFMLRVGHDFRRLTSAYMKYVLLIIYPNLNFDNFCFLGVGTRSDQDDIDIGVVDRGPENRHILNEAIGKMSCEMLKNAISPHFHLSEHVGNMDSYSASLEEYIDLLEKEIHDFVIISEMLGAARVLGSRKLYFEFRRRVTSRYYFNKNEKTIKFHEGYLRGIIGEIRSLMFRDPSKNIISPKTDGLRMIKGMLYAAKTIFNLRQINAWTIIDTLEKRDKKRRVFYQKLKANLTFLETFRYLYQLLIAQEEDIFVESRGTRSNLAEVAKVMGYRSVGAASAVDFMLIDYYQNIQQAKETIKHLLPHGVKHLESITVFGKVLRHKKATQKGQKRIGNLALRFYNEIKFFRGTKFWDDIIIVFIQKDGRIFKRLINDLCTLHADNREMVMNGIVDWGWNSFHAMFSFILLLFKYRNAFPDNTLYLAFNRTFFNRVRGTREDAQRFSILFHHFPQLVNNFLHLLTDEQKRILFDWLNREVWDRELYPARNRLQFLLKLHYSTSKYFSRVMDYVLSEHPEYLKIVDNYQHLVLIGKGSLAEVERSIGLKNKLKKLEDYFHFEFFRIGLLTLARSPAKSVAMEFTAFIDKYMQLLFDTCKRDVDDQTPVVSKTRDLFGIFITGGQGQMLAFDDDFDLIILLNSNDKDMLDYCSSIVRKMHKELIKCGIMPHYRFADYTGSFIATFEQLKELLKQQNKEHIIDKSQLLNARMLIGSSILQNNFDTEILTPYIFSQSKLFVKEMLYEIKERRRAFSHNTDSTINIKETPGGLRDIEMFLFINRTLFELRQHSNFELFQILISTAGSLDSEYKRLAKAYEFLRSIRNLNRLTLGATDYLDPQHIYNLAELLNYRTNQTDSSRDILLQRIKATLRSSYRNMNYIIEKLFLPRLGISKGEFIDPNL
ncbi:hypothetical protein JW935_18770 [candidate division KSB1 bacterium]|nr:hypothetical protein [candidate division KSB1 bacterium]